MKIVALLPVKNESWILPSYLSSVAQIADHIIALDDSSTDTSKSILEAAGATVISFDTSDEQVVNMGKRRQLLLETGRAALGTHFIWLDADETFSTNFIEHAREIIQGLQPGQKLSMRWIHIWKNKNHYLNDTKSPFGYVWKDFIVADKTTDNFTEKFLSEARTPGSSNNVVRLPESQGVVLHWQFLPFDTNQYKQALYRCIELIEGSRSAQKINNTYAITLDNPHLSVEKVPNSWIVGAVLPDNDTQKVNYYQQQLERLFTKHGIAFFEPLQIWHIPALRQAFLNKCKREPKSQTFPWWLIALNNFKNKLRYG